MNFKINATPGKETLLYEQKQYDNKKWQPYM